MVPEFKRSDPSESSVTSMYSSLCYCLLWQWCKTKQRHWPKNFSS